MTYIGQQPATTFDAGIQDRFTGLSTNTVTLTHEIAAEEDILVVWNNIVQDKNTYSVGGTGNKTLTLGGTLVSADVVTVYYLNKVMQSVNPTAGSVNTDQLATNAVTNAKMADDAIGVAELSATGTASSSTFLRGDNAWATAGGDNTPSFRARTSSLQTFSSGYQKVQYDAEEWDTDGVFDHTTNYRFTAPANAKYHITIYHRQNGTSAQALNYGIVLYKNGSGYRYHNANPSYGGNVERYGITYSEDIALSTNDYLEVYINGGGFELGAGSGIFMAHKLIGV